MRRFTFIVGAVLLCAAMTARAATGSTIYDPNPKHLWNRLNETLFLRTAPDGKTFGLDELDILYWWTTTNLLEGASHGRAIWLLAEFNKTRGENLIDDPLKRALLQRDLWELFDWSAKPNASPKDGQARHELQTGLVLAIQRLALTSNEITSLPDNYAKAEANTSLTNLPRGLSQTNGDWVNVRDADDFLTKPTHVSQFNGHSIFNVYFPGTGRARGGTWLSGGTAWFHDKSRCGPAEFKTGLPPISNWLRMGVASADVRH